MDLQLSKQTVGVKDSQMTPIDLSHSLASGTLVLADCMSSVYRAKVSVSSLPGQTHAQFERIQHDLQNQSDALLPVELIEHVSDRLESSIFANRQGEILLTAKPQKGSLPAKQELALRAIALCEHIGTTANFSSYGNRNATLGRGSANSKCIKCRRDAVELTSSMV
jgi:hypothetical protein